METKKDFKFDAAYRATDEYRLFCECLKTNGVDTMLWEHAIMIHKSCPLLYRNKSNKDEILAAPKNILTTYDTVEILPPQEGITVQ